MRFFCVYYGWLTIIHDWSPYAFVIVADYHPDRQDRLEDLVAEVPETYFYLDAHGISQQNTLFDEFFDNLKQLNISGIFLDRFDTKELTADVTNPLIKNLRKKNFKIIANGKTELQYLSLIDYFMIEGFLGSYEGRPDNFQLEFAPFTSTEGKIRSLKSEGVKLIAVSYGEKDDLEKEKYCYLSALLFGIDAFCYANPSLMTPYTSRVHYELGVPLDRYHLRRGTLTREFEQGTVIIDPNKRQGFINPR